MIHLFCGYERREAIGFHVFVSSVLERASQPVSIHALSDRGLPVGSNAFTVSRFLVPWLCGYHGHAIFVDASDMVCLGDVAELDSHFEPDLALQVVRRPDYRTRHPIKYIGTSMQCPNVNYPRKNWASVMLINCAHASWRTINPQFLETANARDLLRFAWLNDLQIGSLPDRWNRIVDEGDSVEGADLLHWTAGIPAFPAYRDAPGASQWREAHERMQELA